MLKVSEHFSKAGFFRNIKTLHSWLGFIILPWIIFYGFTGFYLNHSKMINQFLAKPVFDESQFEIKPENAWLSIPEARGIAEKFWRDETITNSKAVKYHGFIAINFTKPSGSIIVAIQTGHFYKKTRFYRNTYDASGHILDRKFYWSYLFSYFHEVGWINNSFGVWFADVTAMGLIFFGVTGLVLFILPRQRKILRLVKNIIR